jgi:tripartite-type tricarboxylate transporter receptor subunit TctC
MKRRLLLKLAAGMALLPRPSIAQSGYPDRPVRIVVPYPAGGSLDAVARPLSQVFQEMTGQPLVIDNRGGGNAVLGTDFVAKSRPDGHTLLMATSGPLGIARGLGTQLPYDAENDVIPITNLVNIPFTLFASTRLGARTLAEVIAAGRAAPDSITFGLPGQGSVGHLAQAMMMQATNTRWLTVQYRGAALALNDMAAGTIALTFTTIASARPLIEAGHIRAIAVTGTQRTAAMPDLPSFGELGYPQVNAPLWIGMMAPRGTPAPVVERLHGVFSAAMQGPVMRNAMAPLGADILNQGPAAFAALLREDAARWGEVIRRGNIRLD